MKIIVKATGEIIGRVETNHSMDIYTACEFAGIDIDDYDVEADLEIDFAE
jgi:hypothetical protein